MTEHPVTTPVQPTVVSALPALPTASDDYYYHVSTTDHGGSITFDNGGCYERLENGTPQLAMIGGEYVGFKTADTPTVCAAEHAAGALFAVAHGSTAGQFHVYRTTREPDVAIESHIGDFAILDEVRYREPAADPVTFEHSQSVDVPQRAVDDVDLAYLPPEYDIITEWGELVRATLATTLLVGDEYPTDLADAAGVTRPQPDAYRDPYELLESTFDPAE